MSEFKGTKEDKALQYAKESWGVYFDDKHPDIAIEFTQGQITQTDYLNGYNQALKDSCASEVLEALKESIKLLYRTTEFEMLQRYREKVDDFEQLINKASTI